MTVVVVGASTAGLATVETLRAEGFSGRIVLLGAEHRAPYRRPALSKQLLLGHWEAGQATLADASDLEGLGVEHRLGQPAVGLDPDARTVHTAAGSIGYDSVVIATGAAARRPAWADPTRVHTLRTLDDAVRLAAQLTPAPVGPDQRTAGPRVAVLGAGVLGSEIAAAARHRGAQVTLVEASAGPSLGAAGLRFADRLTALHTMHGVEVRSRSQVVAVTESGVQLADGSTRPYDVVVAAAGAEPAVSWLADSGLLTEGRLLADGHGRVADGVWAAGDASAWLDPLTGLHSPCGHQLTAMEQGQAVARLIACGRTSPYPVPYFWSEIHGTRVQAYGRLELADSVALLEGDGERDLFAFRSGGRTCGLVAWNLPKPFRSHRAALMAASELLETRSSS